jgi:hypothetical protein
MDCKRIIKTYERIKNSCHPTDFSPARQIIELTAYDLGVDFEDVRQVMVEHWTMRGAG